MPRRCAGAGGGGAGGGGELHARGASPGLMRRRYSAPETIMRKYRLAQQRSDSEGVSPVCAGAAAMVAAPPSPPCAARELMRREALLRRLWGRTPPAAARCHCCATPGDAPPGCGRASRSLDGSRCELRAPRSLDCVSPPAARQDRGSSDSSRASVCVEASSYVESTPDADDACCVTIRSVELGSPPSNAAEVPTASLSSASRDRSTLGDVRFCVGSESRVATSPPYELLEIVVSETFERGGGFAPTPDTARLPLPPRRMDHRLDLDEYVSNILVESLNSLTDQIESMNASIGDRKISIVEKEIKVRLQNTGVNTVVHLSPTSNNQIIFGNEELYERDACDDPQEVSYTTYTGAPGGVGATDDLDNTVLQEPNNNCVPSEPHGVLQQLRRLFGEETAAPPAPAARAFLSPGYPPAGVGPVAAARSLSTEACVSSDDAGSPCASLVDSLDDPNSPRGPPRRPAAPAVRPPPVEPATPRPATRPGPAFFVPITDDDCDRENVRVADRLPERIKRKLQKRHRRREQRIECARRGRRGEREEARRESAAVVEALVDDVVAEIARDEYRCLRVRRRRGVTPPTRADRASPAPATADGSERRRGADRTPGSTATYTGPSPTRGDRRPHRTVRGPRRVYHKSEIHDGGKCIEILEILEYAAASRSSSEPASDESASAARGRRSRIPVPVTVAVATPEPAARRASVPPAPAPSSPGARRSRAPLSELRFERVFDAIPEERGESPARRGSVPAGGESCARRGRPCRSAATSPARTGRDRVRSASTMTSPAPPRRARAALPGPLTSPGIGTACAPAVAVE